MLAPCYPGDGGWRPRPVSSDPHHPFLCHRRGESAVAAVPCRARSRLALLVDDGVWLFVRNDQRAPAVVGHPCARALEGNASPQKGRNLENLEVLLVCRAEDQSLLLIVNAEAVCFLETPRHVHRATAHEQIKCAYVRTSYVSNRWKCGKRANSAGGGEK